MQSVKVEILKQNGYNFLWIDDYLWMWDIPVERAMQKKIADACSGNVLIAGYGLGIVQKYLVKNPKVTTVFTLEKYSDVIKACLKEYGVTWGTIKAKDFYTACTPMAFDFVIGDIWEEISSENLPKYKKFKKRANDFLKPGGKILAWGGDYFEYLIDKE